MNILCFDVGGTSIKHAILNEKAEIFEKGGFPAATESMDAFLSSIREVYECHKDDIEGVSFSMPGVIDPDTGFFYTGGAYDEFIHDTNMSDIFHTFIDRPLTITNDAKCAAYGELGYGCLKDINDAVVLVLGTGIGGCLIKDRKPIYGKHLYAGEFSFINLTGTVKGEDLFARKCGAQALEKLVQRQLETEEHLDGHRIFQLANAGDERVLKALHDFCFDLAMQIYNLQVIFDPEVFAIGGGISSQKILFGILDECFEQIREGYGPMFFSKPEVVACLHRNDANLIGALYRFISEENASAESGVE